MFSPWQKRKRAKASAAGKARMSQRVTEPTLRMTPFMRFCM